MGGTMHKKREAIQGLAFITPAITILGIFVFASKSEFVYW
jgi:hypothetical protein